jgi:uncharacterized protein (DUF952 family)/isopentenyldiphosphate isomerase
MSVRIIIVDERDTPIGLKGYAERQYEDMYRVTALWLTDRKTGDVLLQQRKMTKHIDPGKWQCAVSGTIEEGETYEQNIVHEIEEEIGLHNLALTEGPKQYIDDGSHKFFCQWFRAKTDKNTAEIVIQESELEATQWIAKDDLIADVTANPDKYAPSMMSGMEVLGIVDKSSHGTIIAIAKENDWQAAQVSGYYTKSTIELDLRDTGFLHCSFPNQTVDIASRHFLMYGKLTLLFIDPLKVNAVIKYEGARSGRPGTFPHIYGPLNVDAVYNTAPLLKKNSRFVAPEKLSDLIKTGTV